MDNNDKSSPMNPLTKQKVLEMMQDIGDEINYALMIKEKVVALFERFNIRWYDLVYYSPEQACIQYEKETGASKEEALQIIGDYLKFKQN